jgi:hypothetical protein
MIAFNSKYCSWLLRCAVLGVSLTFFAPAPATAGGELPYIKIRINGARDPDIGRNGRVGFARPVNPDSLGDENVYHFNGIKIKQLTNNGGTINDIQASGQRLAWVRFGLTPEGMFGSDLFSYDDKKVRNVSNDNEPSEIQLDFDLAGKNLSWASFVNADLEYHVFLNKGGNQNIKITEGTEPHFRTIAKTSTEGNVAWGESNDQGFGAIFYYDGNDEEIRSVVSDDQENGFFQLSGHRVAWITRDSFGDDGVEPGRLKLYNGNTEQTTILAEGGGPFGEPVPTGTESYDHPYLLWQGVIDPETFESTFWLMNVSTGETIDLVEAVAPFTLGSIPALSEGFVAFLGGDGNGNGVVAIYDINRDKVRVIHTFPPDATEFSFNVRISGPNVVWDLFEFLDEPPFVRNSAVVAYRLDEYIKILLNAF